MVAVLQAPPEESLSEEYAYRRGGHARHRVAAHVVPLRVVPAPDVLVHRQPSPRVTRSHHAAVYWRRRLVAAALGLGALLTVAHAGAALGGSTTAPERSPQIVRVVAGPGDTLWSIARRVAPNQDPRSVVDKLTAERGTSAVQPGDAFTWSK